mmetsp:Transcript_14128/g.34545  ORF Transcript_14128/g.34545 Transcript_14128/m.34545 type:complete len:301 (+) Transcript_14128:336-1238(+)
MNTALVFLKPHAVNEKVDKFAREHLAEKKVKVVNDGVLSSEEIKSAGMIDTHYAALAASAVKTLPANLGISAAKKDEFKEKFGVGWDEAAGDGALLNLAQFQSKFPAMKVADIEAKWRAGPTMKLAPGNYVSQLTEEKAYVINGFYGSMREKFIAPGVQVQWYLVEFDPSEVPWKAFRGSVIGATDPTAAEDGSLRSKILKSWKDLELAFEPSTADNGVHASAGPIEGLKERMTWLGVKAEDDPFGKALAGKGVTGQLLAKMLDNEIVELPGGEKGPCFDVTEDMDSSTVLDLAEKMAKS